jgi:hypothetical protein
MPEKHLFEYAVIRAVPRVEREEFLNVGVILYCRSQRFLDMRFVLDEKRLQAFSGKLNIQEAEICLQAFGRICRGEHSGGPIAKLDMASRFRWLIAYRSTIIQTSRVHPGFCADARKMLEHLHQNVVLFP